MSVSPAPQPTSATPLEESGSGGSPKLLGLILLLALFARLIWAGQKGLVLDEFHTLFHASQTTWALFIEHLGQDNHPPLAFLLVNATRRVFGDSDFQLRIPAIIAGMIELILILRIARSARVAKPLMAVALLAASSLHLDCSAQVRMYSLLALSVTACVDGILRLMNERASRAAAAQVTIAVAAGLNTHYIFGQDLIWMGIAWVTGWFLLPELRARLKRVMAPVFIGVALALPWYLTVFRTQWGHELQPGGDELQVLDYFEAFIHQFFLNVSIAGPAARLAFIAAGITIPALAVVGWFRMIRSQDAQQRFAATLLGAIAFGVPSGAWTLASYMPRAGFTWHYILPSAGALAVLASASARCSFRAGLLRAAMLSAALLCVLNMLTHGTEDYPQAVRYILRNWDRGDALIVVEYQPEVFPIGSPWDRYAPRMSEDGSRVITSPQVRITSGDWDELPTRIPMNLINLANPDDLIEPTRVWVMASALPNSARTLKRLRERFSTESKVESFGHRPIVYLFED
jgi:hypothetical protein